MIAPKVVFVLSANYSGSHLLAQLLAAHSRCAGVGELHNYRKFRERGSRSGNVVNDYQSHPAFADLDRLPVDEWHDTLFARLREPRPDLSHLIDNSKRPQWASRFPEANAYLLHLVRDPRALVARWARTYDSEAARRRQRRRVLLRRPWAIASTRDAVGVYVEKWLLANRAITAFLRHRARAQVLTYRDLARATQATLETLMPGLDLEFEPGQLDYGRAAGALGTRKREYQAAARDSVIELDLRWQSQLDPSDLHRIERHRGVRRYLRALDLIMTPDGLTAGGPATTES